MRACERRHPRRSATSAQARSALLPTGSASRVVDIREPEHMAELIGQSPGACAAGYRRARPVGGVTGAAVERRLGAANEVGYDVVAADEVAVREQICLLRHHAAHGAAAYIKVVRGRQAKHFERRVPDADLRGGIRQAHVGDHLVDAKARRRSQALDVQPHGFPARQRTGGRAPVDGAMLELAVAAEAVFGAEFVAGRVAEETALPAHFGPQVADRTMHLVRAGRWRPVDRAGLEVVVAADAVARCGGFVRPTK